MIVTRIITINFVVYNYISVWVLGFDVTRGGYMRHNLTAGRNDNGWVSRWKIYYGVRRTPKKTLSKKGEVFPKRKRERSSPRRLRSQA